MLRAPGQPGEGVSWHQLDQEKEAVYPMGLSPKELKEKAKRAKQEAARLKAASKPLTNRPVIIDERQPETKPEDKPELAGV